MKTIKHILIIVGLVFMNHVIHAQEEESPQKSSSDLAKELANPNATLGQMLFPIDFIGYNGDINDASSQSATVINFQPSLPIPISEGVNLYVRPLIPMYISQPTITANGFEQKSGLGNISADVAIGKTWPSKWITLVGVFGGFKTASDEALRASYTTIGPEIMVAKLTSFGALGMILTQAWSVGSGSDADPNTSSILADAMWQTATTASDGVSITGGQYFYTINLKNGWQINASPTFAYNHKAASGNKLTLPLGTGIQKVTKIGKLPIRFGAQYWYYVASPDAFGPQHQFRLTIAPVIPLPW
ncbi:hypothetical protein J4050_07025 [Winogradskyella sp. DF17]|uniref:Transporter n=1 Tax=Winogradskyella pelagia TaxID=2819984 RepID=A0ABS3T173_9FLAO|nr:hypothetical protein [Winogradskyella sp. DF17]MBO3116493.1 hypothetical protein [Winogradskyella sp. DF17]